MLCLTALSFVGDEEQHMAQHRVDDDDEHSDAT